MAKRSFIDTTKAQARSATSEAAEEILQRQQVKEALLPLDKIGDRPTGDTRKINLKHINELVESITVLGLITPLTVDKHYKLLAGGHRRAALEKLAQEHPERFNELFGEGVPVNIMDIDGENQTVKALQIEVEENTQRKNYTPSEIREAARKLEEAGYEKLKGRPAEGQKSMNRELESVFGLSRRQITRIMTGSKQKEKSETRGALFSKIPQYRKETEAFKSSLIKNQLKSEITAEFKEELQILKKTLREVCDLLEKLEELPNEEKAIQEENQVGSDPLSKEAEE